MSTETKPKSWYAKTTNTGSPHEQGLIIDETTGANIAVAYDPKHAPLLAAAPDLVAACEWLMNIIENHGADTIHNGTARKYAMTAARAALSKSQTP